MILVKDIRSLIDGTRKRVRCIVEYRNQATPLHFLCESDLTFSGDKSADTGLLLALLWPAMLRGENLHIEGQINEELLYVANNDLQSLLLTHEPRLSRISVIAREHVPDIERSLRRVATGFSAGVDSFTTLRLFSANDVPSSKRVSALTTFNVGALGRDPSSRELFKQYSKRNADFARNSSRSWINVDSNLDQFYGPRFRKTHILRNVAAAYLVSDLLSDYYYSSSYDYRHTDVKNNSAISFIEPLLLPLLSTRELRFYSTGAGLSKADKIKLISDYEPAFDMLDTCAGHPGLRIQGNRPNCSVCGKCSRVMLALDALGRLENFRTVFDLERCRSERDAILETVKRDAVNGTPGAKDVLALLSMSKSTISSATESA